MITEQELAALPRNTFLSSLPFNTGSYRGTLAVPWSLVVAWWNCYNLVITTYCWLPRYVSSSLAVAWPVAWPYCLATRPEDLETETDDSNSRTGTGSNKGFETVAGEDIALGN